MTVLNAVELFKGKQTLMLRFYNMEIVGDVDKCSFVEHSAKEEHMMPQDILKAHPSKSVLEN